MATRRAVKSSSKPARARRATKKRTAKRRTAAAKKHSRSGSFLRGRGKTTKTSKSKPKPKPKPKVKVKVKVKIKPKAPVPTNGTKTFPDSATLDRRIIEGMLNDRTTLMAEMADRGHDQAAVLRRAAELGLSEALIRQVRGVAADLAGERPGRRGAPEALGARTCLCCDRIFLSSGPSNRLCMRCRGGDAGLAQL